MSLKGDLSLFGKNITNTVISKPVNTATGFVKGLPNAIKGIPSSLGNTILGEVERGMNSFFASPNLRDYTHASKFFLSNSHENAPKHKHLFHVSFAFADELTRIIFPNISKENMPNPGMLVKSVDLPKFQIKLEELNQYNKKKFVQTKINHDSVKITMHDDCADMITKLWYAYYTYYYGDSTADVVKSSPYDNVDLSQWGYTGNAITDQKKQFFKYISIYSLHQGQYSEYRLINPMIENFSHDSHDYSAGNAVLEHSMSLKFETVQYFTGSTDKTGQNTVNGFGAVANPGKYDATTSPIKDANGLMDDLKSGDWSKILSMKNAKEAAQTFAKFKNPSDAVNAGIAYFKEDGINLVKTNASTLAEDLGRKINFSFGKF